MTTLPSEGMDVFTSGMREYTEPERARLDEADRAAGRIASRGIIIAVEDPATGAVIVRTTSRAEIHAAIKRKRYPIPRVGDEVEIVMTSDRRATADPVGPELDPVFTATVLTRAGDTSKFGVHGGIVEHADKRIAGGRVFAQGGVGVDMRPATATAAATRVVCNIAYQGLVADSALVEHEIYAVSEIPGPGTIREPGLMPAGGAEDARLTKRSSADFDVEWET